MTPDEAPDPPDVEEQRRRVASELEVLVGRVVTAGSVIDYGARLTIALLTLPLEVDLRAAVETGLHSRHSGELAATVQLKIQSEGHSLGVTSAQFGKFLSLWSWYEKTLVEDRNRLVHDAYVFGLDGEDYGLAKIITGKSRNRQPVPAGLAPVRELANAFANMHLLTFRTLNTLSAMAEGTFSPPPDP